MSQPATWVTIPATDLERAVAFYGKVLEMELSVIDCDDERMACFDNGAGCLVQSPRYRPSAEGAIVSLAVTDLDAAIDRAVAAGGALTHAKTAIETETGGFFALLSDSEGNTIGLHHV